MDYARMAGLFPAGVICEIMNPDGTMARLPQLQEFAAKHGLKMGSVADLVAYRRRHEVLICRGDTAKLPTRFGEFAMTAYRTKLDDLEHAALVYGDVRDKENVLVRVHSECLTGDVFGSLRCDCGQQLHQAMRQIVEAGAGVVVYLRQEGRGIGLTRSAPINCRIADVIRWKPMSGWGSRRTCVNTASGCRYCWISG